MQQLMNKESHKMKPQQTLSNLSNISQSKRLKQSMVSCLQKMVMGSCYRCLRIPQASNREISRVLVTFSFLRGIKKGFQRSTDFFSTRNYHESFTRNYDGRNKRRNEFKLRCGLPMPVTDNTEIDVQERVQTPFLKQCWHLPLGLPKGSTTPS